MDHYLPKDGKTYQIVMLTNRDSDNLGDQILEACDISILKLIFQNLGISEDSYKIISRAESVVSKKYVETGDPALLKTAEHLVQKADILIFGGAPLLNYRYGTFSDRTVKLLELAEAYKTPVLFSAVGVNGYDEDHPKCRRLVQALNRADVRQITTRDDLEALTGFIRDDSIRTERVADPAVLSSSVFRQFVKAGHKNERKKIGIFVPRKDAFVDNDIAFTGDDAARLWTGLADKLTALGYDYEFLTSGHCCDEAFLDALIRQYGVDDKKCVFNMNTPEQLIEKISSYDAVVSARLHPSVVAYSLGIPSVGIVWNAKVKFFYEAIGYDERCVGAQGLTADRLAAVLQTALKAGVKKDPDYIYSIYRSLYAGIGEIIFRQDKMPAALPFEELERSLSAYPGTTQKQMDDRIRRKFRRIYDRYNALGQPQQEDGFISRVRKRARRAVEK